MRLIKGRSFYKEPWYNSYHSMMDRCYRKTAKNYSFYGGRGISVCPEWHNIEAFESWAKESGFRKGLTLERKDVNGDYCPENCTWATKKQQANNRRNTVVIEYNGESHTVSEWSDILGVSRSTINNRYHRGLPTEKVLAKEDLRCPV
jgi:hypothetical protein